MKKKLLFLLIFMAFFLVVSLQTVPGVARAPESYTFDFSWYAPGATSYYHTTTSSYTSGGSHKPESTTLYYCGGEGTYKVQVHHYCSGGGQGSVGANAYDLGLTTTTFDIYYDSEPNDCDWYNRCNGGNGGVPCEQGERICWTGSKCCGDDSGETYEDYAAGRSCCYNGYGLPNNAVGDGTKIPNNLLCYNGTFYSCNYNYGFASYNKGSCYKIGSYYCAPSPTNRWVSGTGEDVSCGDCKACKAGECKSKCVPCQYCSGGAICEWVAPGSSSSACGINSIIDCSGWFHSTGIEGPNDVEQCWNYADITSGQCKSGGCKIANSSDCEIYSTPDTPFVYECGECQYIAAGGCSGTNKSSCTYYAGTRCSKGGECGTCDGAGTCITATNCEDGTSIGVCSADNPPKYCDSCGILYNDCGKCGTLCPDGWICQASGCVNPDIVCSDFNKNNCDSTPGCFWNGINCSSCTDTGITGCDSYTQYGNATCNKDICNIAGQSSCGWDSATSSCFKLTEDCYSIGDEDNNGKADCEDSACDSLSFCQSSGTCGDDIINRGEECDRATIPYGMNCLYFGLGNGDLTCIPPGRVGECKFNFSNCQYQTPPGFNPDNCGNGSIDSGEICDTSGPKLGGKKCEDFGFLSGNLECFFCTRLGTSSCLGTVSKEGNAAACVDGDDNDNDEATDYEDADCQDPYKTPNPEITREGGICAAGERKVTATLEYTYYLRFGLGEKVIKKDVEVTCPVPIAARLPFFSSLSFLLTVVLLFAYYILREKKVIGN